MKTQILGSCLALALGLFACAAPTEEDIAQSAAANAPAKAAEEPGAEHTGETKEAFRIRLNEGCALTCSGGNQTCCCGVGQKCESGATYCVCKDAGDTRFSGEIFGKIATP